MSGAISWRRAAAPAPEAAPLAYVMNLYPNLTETFVYREVEAVRRRGRAVLTVSMRRPDVTDLSAEALPHIGRTHYLLPAALGTLLRAHLVALCTRPRRYLGTLARLLAGRHASLRDRLRTLCHFAEGVLLTPVLRAAGVRHIHAHFAVGAATVAWTAARLLDLRFSMTAHAYDIWQDRLLLPEKLAAAAFTVTCTEHSRQHLVTLCPTAAARIHRLYHGIDVERFSPVRPARARPPRILSVGRLVEQKGFPVLLRACARLAAAGEDFECVIAGDGPLRVALERDIATLGLTSRVRLVGRVFQEAMPTTYRDADLFALACQRASDGDMDGIPNVMWEAMASGLPVVSTRLSGVPEAVLDGVCGLLVEPGDEAALAAALTRLLRDAELRRRLGAEARRRAAGWLSLDHSAAALLAHIDAATAPAAGAATTGPTALRRTG